MFKNGSNKVILRNIAEMLTIGLVVIFLVPLFLVLINAGTGLEPAPMPTIGCSSNCRR